MKFSAVKWQDDIIDSLKTSIKNATLGHALLFCGEKNTCITLANCTADALLCDLKQGDFCGQCPSCIKINAKSHPDKVIISAKKASIGVDEIRSFIADMYVKPFIGNKKVYIFEDGSKLTSAAQNALLKVLEAPPDYGVIILVADKEEDLLPTVLSRLKKYQLSIPTGEQVGKYLASKYPEKRELAYFCAKFCEGSQKGAEDLLLNGGDHDKRKRLCLFLDKLCGENKSAVFDFSGYLEEHKDEFDLCSSYLFSILRDLMFVKQNLPQTKIINSDLYSEIKTLSAKMDVDNVTFITNNLTDCIKALKGNASFPLIITNFLLKTWEDLHDRNSWSKI